MGNREKLMAGARRCLHEKGYVRTTARDVAAAAGVSLAAIGYHFGTTEALLSAALVEALREWGDELDRTLRPGGDIAETWDRVIASVHANPSLWTIQFEVLSQLDRLPELRELFLGAQAEARAGLAALFEGIDPASEPGRAQRVGAVYQAMLTGVVAQHLTDRETAPTGGDLARGAGHVRQEPDTMPS